MQFHVQIILFGVLTSIVVFYRELFLIESFYVSFTLKLYKYSFVNRIKILKIASDPEFVQA